MSAAALVDTNVLVYRYDPRFPEKQRDAVDLLRWGLELGTVVLAHQVLIEFVAATTRQQRDGTGPILTLGDAAREVESLILQFPVLYPDGEVVRTALRGRATYGLSWYDAHLWAYAERFGLSPLFSEDFQDGRIYGTVRVLNPFADSETLHEFRAEYGIG